MIKLAFLTLYCFQFIKKPVGFSPSPQQGRYLTVYFLPHFPVSPDNKQVHDTSSRPPYVPSQWLSLPVHLGSFFCRHSPSLTPLSSVFIREGSGMLSVLSDSCSNSYAHFQRADVSTGASHAYFPRGDAFSTAGLSWNENVPFNRNTSWEPVRSRVAKKTCHDHRLLRCVCVCQQLTAEAKLSVICDNWTQMCESHFLL